MAVVRIVDAVEPDTFSSGAVQDFDGVAVEDGESNLSRMRLDFLNRQNGSLRTVRPSWKIAPFCAHSYNMPSCKVVLSPSLSGKEQRRNSSLDSA